MGGEARDDIRARRFRVWMLLGECCGVGGLHRLSESPAVNIILITTIMVSGRHPRSKEGLADCGEACPAKRRRRGTASAASHWMAATAAPLAPTGSSMQTVCTGGGLMRVFHETVVVLAPVSTCCPAFPFFLVPHAYTCAQRDWTQLATMHAHMPVSKKRSLQRANQVHSCQAPCIPT